MKIRIPGFNAIAAPTLSPLIRYVALLALTALANPFTLFGRDSGSYWASAFLAPLLIAGLCCCALLWKRSVYAHDEVSSLFIRLSLIVQVLILSFQWMDV